jgi:hypothetical protein
MRSSGGLGLADAGMEIWAGMALLALLGFVLGFALNRGSICTVIATRELVSEKKPACQSARNFDPRSACNLDPPLCASSAAQGRSCGA